MQPTSERAVGLNGELQFDGHFVTITRRGGRARTTVGRGEKRIPVGQITAVQWKDGGRLTRGFIEFTLGGANENRSAFGHQASDQMRNENAIVFIREQEPPFRALREAIEAAIAAFHTPAEPGAGSDLGTQLQQLSSLHAQGVLTDAEFQAAKARLLGT